MRSRLGEGSTFTLSLQLEAPDSVVALSAADRIDRNGGRADTSGWPADRDGGQPDWLGGLTEVPLAAELSDPRPHVLQTITRLVVLDRDGATTGTIRGLVGRNHGVDLSVFDDPGEAIPAVLDTRPDGLVVGTGFTDADLFGLLDAVAEDPRLERLPLILRLEQALSEEDEARLETYESALLARVATTDEALAAEAALILHPASGSPVTGAITGAPVFSDPTLPMLSGRILLVDDDVRNLFALASLLEDRGLDVLFSETGRDALEILDRDAGIDLVLMDIMMPQMDGYETIKAVRRRPELQSLPIIAVTAKAMQGDREKSLAAGASDYITKPVDPDKLITLVRGWLRV